jgi:spermidine synthase
MNAALLPSPGNRALSGGIFLLCMATLMYELILTRIFSVLMWYHFASMAISLALFGLGTAALVVQLRPHWFQGRDTHFLAARCAVLFALSVALFFAVFVLFRWQPQIGFKVLSFFHQPFYQPFQQGFHDESIPTGLLFSLTALYLITALPFFFSGLALTLLFARHHDIFPRLYCWDLVGAGAGCLIVILLLNLFGGITTLLLISALGVAAGLWLLPRDVAKGHRWGALALLSGLLLLACIHFFTGFAEIRFVRGRYEPNLLWSAWNSFSRVAVYPGEGQAMDQAWGLSRTYRGPVPDQLGMVVDDTGYTIMYRWDPDGDLGFFRNNVIGLAYQLKQQPTALVIGPGGGKDVLTALSLGASQVTALEVNPLIIEAVNDRFGAFTGELYRHPQVISVLDEGRSFIRRDTKSYDVIQASAVFGRMAPAAGAFTLSENNLYTLESFDDYWTHLEDDGILTISRFIFERETLRLVSLALAHLQKQGITDPAAHIAVIRERGLANFMMKKSPFTAEELVRLRGQIRKLAFQEVYLPDRRDGDGAFHDLIAAEGSDAFHSAFPFDVRPVDDDRPFFSYMLKPADFIGLFSFPKQGKFEDRAIVTLRNLLVVVAGCVAVFLILPLLLWQRGGLRETGSGWRVLYFACLGLGFMFIEIGLLRRFILFLGPPIYSLAVILCSLLVFSGFGSLLAGRLPQDRLCRWLPGSLLALVLLSIWYAFGLPAILSHWIGHPVLARCLIAGLLLAPLGLLMGMPMPLGMRLFHRDNSVVPWSWGVNSATSVLGAIMAVAVAMNCGFTVTLMVGVSLYLLALLPVAVWKKE